jgi:hypothetical protein
LQQLYSHNLQFVQLLKEKEKSSISIQIKSNMKLNLFFLSAAAIVNTASGAADYTTADLETVETVPDFVILATTAISTVPFSTITGDIADFGRHYWL